MIDYEKVWYFGLKEIMFSVRIFLFSLNLEISNDTGNPLTIEMDLFYENLGYYSGVSDAKISPKHSSILKWYRENVFVFIFRKPVYRFKKKIISIVDDSSLIYL